MKRQARIPKRNSEVTGREVKLLIGLGNPGKKYAYTWHNAGFLAVDHIGEKMKVRFKEKLCDSLVATGESGGETIILAKPQLYMNLSGGPVADLLNHYSLSQEEMIVIHDDIDIELGKVKEKKEGGAAGHNGVADIIEKFGNGNFRRLRIGVGRPPEGMDPADYVLSAIGEHGKEIIGKLMKECAVKALNFN